MVINPREETGLVKEYGDKIRGIWHDDEGIFSILARKRTILEKLKASSQIIDSVDKIKWPEKIEGLNKEDVEDLVSIAKNQLKIYLYAVVSEMMIETNGKDDKLVKQVMKEALLQ